MTRILNPRPLMLDKMVWSREGIGLETPEIRHRKDAKLGSMILREACLDMFQRTANRFQIKMEDAMACHLGFHSKPIIPGTENAIRGQRAQRMLAA